MALHKILLSTALAAAALLPVSAQQTRLITADKAPETGLTYTLPVTSLRIDVTARQTVRTKGPYSAYAKKYLGTEDVVMTDANVWEAIGATVKPFGVAGEETYVMQLRPGSTTSLCVDENGMLLAINTEAEIAAADAATRQDEALPKSSLDNDSYLQFVDEDFLVATSSTKKAELLAKKIMEVRDARLSLTRGTAETMPTDGRQLELMLNSLAEQEKAMTEAFTGTEVSRTLTRSYILTPGSDDFSIKKTLLRISDFDGFTTPDDMAGEPVYLSLEIVEKKKLPLDEKGEPKKLPKDAVAYCVPGTAIVSVSTPGGTLAEIELPMSQLGYVFGIDPKLFTDKKKPSAATFSPVTGALISLSTL